MVARGDLGIEIAPELVPHIQKEIIAKCNAAYKPVITATQMLDSMQHNPRPTRAEVTDVANAILDGTDAVMLSGETAAGQYPVEAVAMQARIAIETEKYMPAHAELAMPENASGTRVVNNVVGMSAVQMATAVGAKCITVPTTTGRTARLISHFRPNMPICAFSRHEWAVQQMIMYWGVIPRQAEITQGTVNGTIVKAVETAKELGFVEKGDLTVATAGDARLSVELEGKVSSTNLAYVAQVAKARATRILSSDIIAAGGARWFVQRRPSCHRPRRISAAGHAAPLSPAPSRLPASQYLATMPSSPEKPRIGRFCNEF